MTAPQSRVAGSWCRRSGRSEDGTITLWLLGLCVALLFLGGLGLDLWRAYSDRRELAGLAEAAAVAGATAVDTVALRANGTVQLATDEARQRALAALAAQRHAGLVREAVVAATPTEVTVVLSGTVELTLLKVLLPAGSDPLEVQVSATVEARASP